MTDPVAQPPAAPPPTVSPAGAPPPVQRPATPSAERPTPVTIAGIVFIVAGCLTLLIALVGVLGATVMQGVMGGVGAGDFGTDFAPGFAIAGAIAGIIWFLVILIGALGALLLITGIKVLGGAPWARTTGIVLAVIGALFSLGGLTEAGNAGSSLVFLVAYGFATWALWAHPDWFRRPAGA